MDKPTFQPYIPVIKASEKCSYFVGGVEIIFPYKAYPSQLSMMDKIVKSVSKQQNCLLESPTGSGKSLALLCSVLAWQKQFKKKMTDLLEKLEMETVITSAASTQYSRISDSPVKSSVKISHDEIIKVSKSNLIELDKFRFSPSNKRYYPDVSVFSEDDDDFKPPKKFKQQDHFEQFSSDETFNKEKEIKSTESEFAIPDKVKCIDSDSYIHEASFSSDCSTSEMSVETIPKIFFGTRTHKQIAQIIRELKKTSYKDTKMTILSSRDKTCIHPALSDLNGKKKQEECDELLSSTGGPACKYYRNHKNVRHNDPYSLSHAWDIEDFIQLLKKEKACPYFAARALVQESDIIFCPYNYLVDPLIRSSLDISLADHIVIMDEAHNIEDSAREAASATILQSHIVDAIGDLSRKIQTRRKKVNYDIFITLLTKMKMWLEDSEKALTSNGMFESSSKLYVGQEMIALLMSFGAGPEDFDRLKKCFGALQTEESDISSNKERVDEVKLLGATNGLLKNIILVFDFIYRQKMQYMQDYRCVISKKKQWPSTPVLKKKVIVRNLISELSINFWCLNPAVAFSDVKGSVRSIIVTSGTLSPMSSFQSELGIPFEIKLEANHVISRSQMWVGTIGHGPKGQSLNATYANSETFLFQDEIGDLLFQICMIIPHGVLCFLPSYNMLEKLQCRWQTTGLWEKLASKKVIVSEPRGQSQNFDAIMTEFYDAIKESEQNSEWEVNGALFFAVCRGKVSEGLDFADNNARAVVTVGIPFPNIKDFQVDLKKKYNNSLCSVNGIMSGNEWYETQAFRALNQALGRCIRHRNDFGALILVDERFQKQMRYVNSLSKWIRKEVTHFQSCNSALDSLKKFSEKTGLIKKSVLDEDLPL